jgi:acylglycerol lipase
VSTAEVATAIEFGAGLPGFEVRAAKPRAALLIVHGLAEHGERYRSHALALAARGISCVAYDQRGHGAAPGPRTHIGRFKHFSDDLHHVATELHARAPTLPLYVWGHSMGAMVLAAGIATLPIHGAIFASNSLEVFRSGLNPLHPIFQFLARRVPRMRVPMLLGASKISSDPAMQRAYADDPRIVGTASLRLIVEFAAACEQVRATAAQIQLPSLVLHGELDGVAPVAGAHQLFAALGSTDKQLQIFAGQRHEVHNEIAPERARFLDTLANWVLHRAAM